jgi:hypothetical protein
MTPQKNAKEDITTIVARSPLDLARISELAICRLNYLSSTHCCPGYPEIERA